MKLGDQTTATSKVRRVDFGDCGPAQPPKSRRQAETGDAGYASEVLPLHPAQHQAVIGARGSTVMRMALMPSISFEIGDAAGTEIWRSESSQVAPALPE